MLIEARRRSDHKLLGIRYVCNGCDALGRRMPPDAADLPPGWSLRWEKRYSAKGNRCRGQTINYYCPGCKRAGLSAAGIAIIVRKMSKRTAAG